MLRGYSCWGRGFSAEAVDRGELSLDRVVTVPEGFDADLELGGTSQNLKVGEEINVLELLYCALVASANDACNVLAVAVAGDVPSFVSLMNHRSEIGRASCGGRV